MPSELARTIDEQPDRLAAVLGLDLAAAVATLAPARRLTFVGTGTSQHAAELAVWMFGGDRSVGWSSAASFAAREPRLDREDGVVVISHTGETAFARRALELARAAGAGTVAITGDGVGWEGAIETGPRERSETYTRQLHLGAAGAGLLAAELGVAPFAASEIDLVPDRVGAALAEPVDSCNPAGDKGQSVGLLARPTRLAILTGAGPAAITAREGALKLREAAGSAPRASRPSTCCTVRRCRSAAATPWWRSRRARTASAWSPESRRPRQVPASPWPRSKSRRDCIPSWRRSR